MRQCLWLTSARISYSRIEMHPMTKKHSLPAAIALLLAVCLSMTSYASEKKVDWSAIKTFTVLETANPNEFKMRNMAPAVILMLVPGIFANGYRNDLMSEKLSTLIKEKPLGMATAMRQQVVNSLREAGLTEIPAPEIKIDPKNPNDVDYAKIQTQADAIIHVYFDSVGVESPTFSVMYRPHIEATICVVVQRVDGDCILSEDGTYGTKKDDMKKAEIASIEAEQWSSENTVYDQIDAVRDALRSGSALLGGALANKVREPLGLPLNTLVRAPKFQTVGTVQRNDASLQPVEKVAEVQSGQVGLVQPNAQSTQSTQANSRVAAKLRELNMLRSEGLISEAEYNSKRSSVLSTFDSRVDQ